VSKLQRCPCGVTPYPDLCRRCLGPRAYYRAYISEYKAEVRELKERRTNYTQRIDGRIEQLERAIVLHQESLKRCTK